MPHSNTTHVIVCAATLLLSLPGRDANAQLRQPRSSATAALPSVSLTVTSKKGLGLPGRTIQWGETHFKAALTGLPGNRPQPQYRFEIWAWNTSAGTTQGNQPVATSGFQASPNWSWTPPSNSWSGWDAKFVVTVQLALGNRTPNPTAESGPYRWVDDEGARQMWSTFMGPLVTSHRCSNCHRAGDSPTQGDDRHLHVPAVNRQTDCRQCHGLQNGENPGNPPGAPGHWKMPPPAFSFAGKGAEQICRQFKDASKTGGRSLQQIYDHVRADPVVFWAWNPGPGRTPAPFSWETIVNTDFGGALGRWIRAGAACPDLPVTRTGRLAPKTPPPVLTVVTLSHDSISGGPGPISGRVTVSAPAPVENVSVVLASDNPAAIVPASVSVPAGHTHAFFQVATSAVSAPTVAHITASSGAVTVTDSLKVLLAVVSVAEQSVPAGTSPSSRLFDVTLSGPAPPNGIQLAGRAITVHHDCYPVPSFSSPPMPAGATSGVITAHLPPSMSRVWDWYVYYGARSSYSKLAVAPAAIAGIDIPTTLASGTTGSGLVRLSGPTPNQACSTNAQFAALYDRLYTVYFSSSSPVVQVPTSARVDPSQSERPFQLTAATVTAPQTATITVRTRTSTGQVVTVKQATVTVTP